jgi:hypothetical protein
VKRPALALALGVGLGALACLVDARAQDLDAGKTPAQLFASHCAACHRSPQGLAKQSFGLAGFLRQHYTTSSATASALAAYVGAAASDPRAARAPAQGQRGQQGGPGAARPPVTNGGDPRILREPAEAQAAAQPQAPEPPKPRRPRDPRLPVAVTSDPEPFVIAQDPMPLPPDPTPRRLTALQPPAAAPDNSVAAPSASAAGSQAAPPAAQDSEAPTPPTTTAALPADQRGFSAPLP